MSTNVTPLRREGGPLTKEQRDLVKSALGVAERAAYEYGHALGGDPRSADRVQAAHLGIAKAAQTYDPELGPFPPWAKIKAVSEILTTERRERKQKRLVTAGRLVGLRVTATRGHRDGDVPVDASDESLFSALVGIAEDQIVGDWLGVVAAAEEPAEGDEEIAERDAWGVTMAKMVGELDQLAPKHREMLLLFAHGHDIKAQAAERDVDYSTLLDEFHRQCALVKARLKGKKINALPARPKDAPPALPYRAPPESDSGAPTPNEPDKGPPDER
jgi:hypothetical protein